jgi:hypothetical protein
MSFMLVGCIPSAPGTDFIAYQNGSNVNAILVRAERPDGGHRIFTIVINRVSPISSKSLSLRQSKCRLPSIMLPLKSSCQKSTWRWSEKRGLICLSAYLDT